MIEIIDNEDMRYYKKRKGLPIEQRFWMKVIKKDNSDCWLWTGSYFG